MQDALNLRLATRSRQKQKGRHRSTMLSESDRPSGSTKALQLQLQLQQQQQQRNPSDSCNRDSNSECLQEQICTHIFCSAKGSVQNPSAPTKKIKLAELREISTLRLIQEFKPTNPRKSKSPNLTIKESIIHPDNSLGGVGAKYLLCRWYLEIRVMDIRVERWVI